MEIPIFFVLCVGLVSANNVFDQLINENGVAEVLAETTTTSSPLYVPIPTSGVSVVVDENKTLDSNTSTTAIANLSEEVTEVEPTAFDVAKPDLSIRITPCKLIFVCLKLLFCKNC